VNTLPRSAKVLDALVLAFAVLAAAVALSPAPRVRLDLGLAVVSLGSVWRPLLLAVFLLAARHWRTPRPHLGERLLALTRTLAQPDVVLGARMLVGTRLMVLLAGFFAVLVLGTPEPPPLRISRDPLRDLPLRWDAVWYASIARDGYGYDPHAEPDAQQPIAFFPLYPAALRTLAAFTTPDRAIGMGYDEHVEMRWVRLVWGGVAISLAAFFCAVVVIYRWAESRAGPDTAAATVVLLSVYPFAVFFSAAYTESLFLLFIAGACYAFERGRLVTAGIAGVLAGLTRPNGAFLSLALAVLALAPAVRRDPGWPRRTLAGLVAAAMPGVGMLLYSAYVYQLTGDLFGWVDAQAAWGRRFDGTVAHYTWIFHTVAREGLLAYVRALPIEVIQSVAVVFSLAMVWPVWRRIGPAYAVLILANLLPPLFRGGMLSLGRLTATLFPLFLALALLLPPARRTTWIIVFAIGQGLVAAMFFTWRHLY
jgi:hypothetical protein